MENNKEEAGCGGGGGASGGIVRDRDPEVGVGTDLEEGHHDDGHHDHDKEKDDDDKENFGEGAHSKGHLPTYAERSAQLTQLLVEEAMLEKIAEDLKASALGTLVGLSKEIGGKQDEIDRLKKVLVDLMKKEELEEVPASSAATMDKNELEGEGEDDNQKGYRKERSAELIFPEEIWEMILNNLRASPRDFRNGSNTCPLFNKILHPSKAQYLFPLVFPHLCRYLDNPQVLACRQVCKSWNEGIANYLEDHPSLRPFDQESFNPRDPDLQPPVKVDGRDLYRLRNFGNHRQEQQFLQSVWDHPGNPFIGRAVTIQVFQDQDGIVIGDMPPRDWPPHQVVILHRGPGGEINIQMPEEEEQDPRQPPRFYANLFDFLARFGKEISYLTVEMVMFGVHMNGNRPNVFEFLTSGIFHYAPNLRRLRILGHAPSKWADVDLDSMISAPKLESLMIDNLRHFMGLGLVVDSLIRKYHRQLKNLHVKWETLQTLHFHRRSSELFWGNLVELHVDGLAGELNIKPIIHLKMPHLRKLVLTPGANPGDNTKIKMYHFDTVMDIIINLSGTTKLQVLRLLYGFKSEELSTAPATLFGPPSLKTLELELWGSDSNFSFLLRFPFLENLIVFWPGENRYESTGQEMYYKRGAMPNLDDHTWKGDVIDVNGRVAELHKFMYGRRVYECDIIWEMLPRLKVFTFQRDVYTRGGYELFLERKQKMGNADG